MGTVRIGTGGLALLNSTTAPRRNPGAVGINSTFTLQDAVLVVPARQVVPLETRLKSLRPKLVPSVRTCTLPRVVPAATLNGKVRVGPKGTDDGTSTSPKPTDVVCTSK